MKTIAANLSWLFFLASPAALHAGSPPTPAVPPPAPVEAESPFSGEVSLGYDTFYIFRGEELFEQVVWGQISLDFALTEQLSLNLTPWYLSATDDDYSELDLNASVSFDAGFAEFTAGYAGYIYPRGGLGGDEGISDEHEAFLGVAKTFGWLETGVLAAYNFDRDGMYFEATAGASIPLCAAASLDPSVGIGYNTNYFDSDGFTHVILTLAMPVKLTETATLTPYIAGNLPLDVLDDYQDARLFGGVALAVTF